MRLSATLTALTLGFAAVLLGSGCRSTGGSASPLVLIENGGSPYLIVHDSSSAPERFAVKELVEIVKSTTGVELRAVDAASDEGKAGTRRILIGRSSLVRGRVGETLFDSLQPQESLVTARGAELILTGGDDWGTVYAVYDFVENEAGYRNFLPAPGGERFVKADTLRYSGRQTRRIPAFKGYRDGHPRFWPGMDAMAAGKFFFRNRMNLVQTLHGDFAKDSGLREQFHFKSHSHGFHFIGWEETFATHPEYFTMNADGERISNAQLCLSNDDCRRLVTAKVLEIVARDHPDGVNCYVVASNDNWGKRYCWCPDCLQLEKTYNSTGGPLWDYMLELCAEVGKEYPDVFISTLAYKGPQQTEKAPDNIVFPANFIADCAFLNSLRSLKEIPAETLENGERFQKFENLQKWNTIASHVSYWFYGHASGPTAIYERPAQELRELRDAGVESIFVCNFAGDQQFGEVSRYVTLRLMLDPDQDPRALATEAADFFYGDAAEMMMAHIDEMEALRLSPGLSPAAHNPFPAFTMLKPEQILRWRADFDKMEALTAEDPRTNFHVRVSRTAVDVWSMIFLRSIQKEYPDFSPDIQALVDKGLATCDQMKVAKIEPRTNIVRRAFESLQLFAYLKDNTVPPALQDYPRESIIRHLPNTTQRASILVPDADAVTGFAIQTKLPPKATYAETVGFEFYDALEAKWLLRAESASLKLAEIVPGRYTLHRVGTERLPKSSRFVVGNLWGSGLDIDALATYYNPDHHNRQYEIWISLKFEGPEFDPQSKAEASHIYWDQIFLVEKGDGD